MVLIGCGLILVWGVAELTGLEPGEQASREIVADAGLGPVLKLVGRLRKSDEPPPTFRACTDVRFDLPLLLGRDGDVKVCLYEVVDLLTLHNPHPFLP